MKQKYSIVLGTVFGDEGKGMVVDNLCSQYENSLVVRFSGGHNAGHTVMDDKNKHVFSSFGSGTLLGCPSFYTEDTCISLTHMFNELKVLNEKGIEPKLYVHPLAHLTTPYDINANRILEQKNNHGSCGVGIGLTMKRNLQSPYKLYAIDLLNKKLLKEKLKNIRNLAYNFSGVKPFMEEEMFFEYLEKPLPFELKSDWNMFKRNFDHIVFEGSQGILLDMDHGIFPNVTYANTTSKNAWKYISELGVDMYYVSRCYQTRHGNGWMSNEDKPISLINNQEEINVYNIWQGEFRTGEIDWNMITSGIYYDVLYEPKDKLVNYNFVLTCLDQRPDFDFDYNNIPYKNEMKIMINDNPRRGHLRYA